MTYMHRAPSNRAPLTEADMARLEALEAKPQVLGWERGELAALRQRTHDQALQSRIDAVLSKRPSAAQQFQDPLLGRRS